MRGALIQISAWLAVCMPAAASAAGAGITSGSLGNVTEPMGSTSLVYAVEKKVTYGNYCGPVWGSDAWDKTGSMTSVCTAGATLESPKDSLDGLCMDHAKAYCGADLAKQDTADETMINGLKQEKSELSARMVAKGCSTVATAAETAVQTACTASTRLAGTSLDPCVGGGAGTGSSSWEGAQARAPSRASAASAAKTAKGVKASAVGGQGITKLGGNGATSLGPVVKENNETCADMSSKMSFIEAAIVGFTAKREAYAKSLTPVSDTYLCYHPWLGYYYSGACFFYISKVSAADAAPSATTETSGGVLEAFRP